MEVINGLTMAEPIVRPSNPKDLDAVYHAMCELENTIINEKKFREIYLANLKNEDIFYWSAVNAKDEFIGFISLHIQKQLHHASKIGEIMELIIAESFRGMGCGEKLVKTALEQAAMKECIQVEVTTNINRDGAVKFYQKMKFEKTHFKLVHTV